MLNSEFSRAVNALSRWGRERRAEDIGYPQQSFYCAEYRAPWGDESRPDTADEDSVDQALRELKEFSPDEYRVLKGFYVDRLGDKKLHNAVSSFANILDRLC